MTAKTIIIISRTERFKSLAKLEQQQMSTQRKNEQNIFI